MHIINEIVYIEHENMKKQVMCVCVCVCERERERNREREKERERERYLSQCGCMRLYKLVVNNLSCTCRIGTLSWYPTLTKWRNQYRVKYRHTRTHTHTHTHIYIYIYVDRLIDRYQDSLESKMTLLKDKVTLQKVGVTSWKDRNITNMDSTMKEKCPQGDCSGEGEYITHRTCSYGNDFDMCPATTCDCGRKFNSLQGSRIHKARWYNQRMMGLWIRFTPTVFTSPLLSVSVLETFLASQEFYGQRVIR